MSNEEAQVQEAQEEQFYGDELQEFKKSGVKPNNNPFQEIDDEDLGKGEDIDTKPEPKQEKEEKKEPKTEAKEQKSEESEEVEEHEEEAKAEKEEKEEPRFGLVEEEETEEKEEQKDTKQPDFNELLKEKTGGKFESYEQLEKLLEENESLKKGKELPEYSNKVASKFDEFLRNGGTPQQFSRYLQADVSGMSAKDKIVAKMKWESPDLSDREVENFITKQYHLYDEDHEDYNERDADFGQVKLKQDAKEAEKTLEKVQKEFEAPENLNVEEQKHEELEKQNKARLKNWQPKAEQIAKELDTVEIPLPGKNGKNRKFRYKVESDQAELVKQMMGVASNYPQLQPNEDGVNRMKRIAEKAYIADHISDIVNAALSEGRTESDEKWTKERHNPSALHEKDKGRKPSQKRQPDMDDQLLKGWGVG